VVENKKFLIGESLLFLCLFQSFRGFIERLKISVLAISSKVKVILDDFCQFFPAFYLSSAEQGLRMGMS
jgi:hypothetical protein